MVRPDPRYLGWLICLLYHHDMLIHPFSPATLLTSKLLLISCYNLKWLLMMVFICPRENVQCKYVDLVDSHELRLLPATSMETDWLVWLWLVSNWGFLLHLDTSFSIAATASKATSTLSPTLHLNALLIDQSQFHLQSLHLPSPAHHAHTHAVVAAATVSGCTHCPATGQHPPPAQIWT